MTMNDTDKSLNELLAKRGYTTKKANNPWSMYEHHIINSEGAIVFTGDSYKISDWLKKSDV